MRKAITIMLSEETIQILKEIKKEKGIPISQSLEHSFLMNRGGCLE